MIREKEVNNQIRVSNLKKKMIDSINETKSKVDELNVECLDASSRLILLKNNELLLKLEFKTQLINKLNAKNKELEKRIYELKKDIQIHQKVELSLAEKYKKLNNILNKKKEVKKENEKEIDTINLAFFIIIHSKFIISFYYSRFC